MDFFISHAGGDRAWAEWVAWQLTTAGHTVELDAWDWATGDDFVLKMSRALAECRRVVALWSEAFFDPARFSAAEWANVVARGDRWVPLRIEPIEPPPILASVIYRDLFGRTEDQARRELLEAVDDPVRPLSPPYFPVDHIIATGPRLPGALPSIWNVPARPRTFFGRATLLTELRDSLRAGGRTAVYTLRGIGGVGKTQLALEYAHRFAADYEVAWWVNAEQAALIGEQLAALAVTVGVAKPETATPVATAAALSWLRGRDRWLVVLDNAATAREVAAYVPQGPGHVIITSRTPAWTDVAAALSVDIFARSESVALLQSELPALSDLDADAVAASVGDLPLALGQAIGVMTASGMTATEFLRALASHTAGVLEE